MGLLVSIDSVSAHHMYNIMRILIVIGISNYSKNDSYFLSETFKIRLIDFITTPRDEYSKEFSWYIKFSKINT